MLRRRLPLFGVSGAALSGGRSEKSGAQIEAVAREKDGYEQPGAAENRRDPERFDVNRGPRCASESLSESSHFVFSSFSASDVRRRGISTVRGWLPVVAV